MSPGAVNCGRAKAHGCGAWTERIGAACCGDVCRGSGARGSFTDTLDAMLVLIGERMRASLHDADEARALERVAADAVTLARERASGNVNPQLITARLLRELARSLVTKLSHVDESGSARMVDVAPKPDSSRAALAKGAITMAPETFEAILENRIAKVTCSRLRASPASWPPNEQRSSFRCVTLSL